LIIPPRFRLGEVPAFRDKLVDRQLPNAFLHSQFVVQEVISDDSTLAVYAVNPNAVAIAIRTDQADLQIV
jgi:hypothetical protein